MLHGETSLILISITKKRGLLAMVLAAGLLTGAGWLLTRRVLPTMLVEGNRVIMARAAAALEEYYSDHQHWPAGPPVEIFHRLAGRSEEELVQWREFMLRHQEAPAVPEETIRRKQAIPVKNLLRNHAVRNQEPGEVVDAWANSIQYHFPDDLRSSASITSMGPDGLLGTADDLTVPLRMNPQRMTPTPATFAAVTKKRREQEFKAAEQALRKARREAAREAAAAARKAP